MALISGAGWCESALGQQTFNAVSDTWIRASSPDTVYEDDLISAWSTDSGDLRYGLVTFDLTSLAGETIQAVDLQLFVTDDGTQALYPISQTVSIVPGVAAGATWNSYQSTQEPSAALLEGLRHDLAAGQGENTYVSGTPASSADLAAIQAVVDGGGILTLALKAVENGTDYRQDWGDIGSAGQPPKLVITTVPAGCGLVTSLPDAVRGQAYSEYVANTAGCGGPVEFVCIVHEP